MIKGAQNIDGPSEYFDRITTPCLVRLSQCWFSSGRRRATTLLIFSAGHRHARLYGTNVV